MSGPVSDAEMASLQGIMETFLQTEVQIVRRSDSENPYSDDGPVFASPETVPGWVRKSTDYHLIEELAAGQHVDDVRLFLPIGIAIKRGDKVVVAGDDYIVVDTNDNNTWRVTLRVTMRRLD